MNRELGRFGEAWAAGYLTRLGFKILERNVRYRSGELDIVARDGEELVFIEVKCRRNAVYGSPQSSISPRRFDHIESAIARFLSERALDPPSYRLDVIALSVDASGKVSRVEHLRGVEEPTW